MSSAKVAVIGAGPVGLEAALLARELGFEAVVYERGTVGGNVRRWGHVRLFSPFEMNRSARAADALSREGVALPEPGAYLTGAEYASRYLEPLARSKPLAGRVLERTEVVSIGREGLSKSAPIGDPRAPHPFRLLVQDAGGERAERADVVLDCTGTYGNHNWMGSGNVPALGERALEDDIAYELEDVTPLAGKRVLVVGDGYSALTALAGLVELDGTETLWVTPSAEPIELIPDDPLPQRNALGLLARELAAGACESVRHLPGRTVESVARDGGGFEVELALDDQRERVACDRILAHVGYRPDRSMTRELQVHECYASEAPMKLAAALLGESSAADCLTQTSKGVDVLKNPEPNFFILGAKSYGRGSAFLIRIGIQQVEEVFSLLRQTAPEARAS